MRELARSLLSMSWSLPVLGAQQLAEVFAARPPARGAAAPLDDVTVEARRRMGPQSSRIFSLFDRAQDGAADLLRQALGPEPLDAGTLPRLAAELARRTAGGFEVLFSGGAPAAGVELLNKAEVYVLVRENALILGIPDRFPLPIQDLAERAYGIGEFPALWAVEGLGHDWGVSFSDRGRTPHGLLTGRVADGLPEKSMLMLHAGVGLWAAQLEIDAVAKAPTRGAIDESVDTVVRLCRDNSRPGDLGAAYESLGLVTRLFHPPLLSRVNRAVRRVAPQVHDYFWHGAGRAIYFSPLNFLPCSSEQVFSQARHEATGERAWLNAVTGLAWAITLVNQRQPWILEELWIRPHGDELAATDAFAEGVASSIAMRAATTPGAALIEDFVSYRPARGSARRWDQLVGDPARRALALLPALEREGRMGEIFRYGFWRGLFRERRGWRG